MKKVNWSGWTHQKFATGMDSDKPLSLRVTFGCANQLSWQVI